MVNKAVIPAAGLGTRFLPASKAQPKEMMPVLGKPTIQYVVEEAVNSGIDDILIITGRGKQAIERHFDKSYELEQELKKAGKENRLERVKDISDLADIHYVRQKERLGLGDAVLYAKKHVDNEEFALLLGDTIMRENPPTTKQLIQQHKEFGDSVVSLERVQWDKVPSYGIASIDGDLDQRSFPVKDFIEKPDRDKAPSNLAITGRYILTPKIFDLLKDTDPGVGGELQLTDAIRKLKNVRGYVTQGRRYDIGNIPDWIKANIHIAHKENYKNIELENYMRRLLNEKE